MRKNKNLYTALALFSSGLDSILAVKIIQKQSINVIPVCFVSPFFDCKKAEKSAEMLGLKLQIRELNEEYLNIIKNPKYGYGKHLKRDLFVCFDSKWKIVSNKKIDTLSLRLRSTGFDEIK